MGQDDGVGDPVRDAELAAEGVAQAVMGPHPRVGHGERGEEGGLQHVRAGLEIASVANAQGKGRCDS